MKKNNLVKALVVADSHYYRTPDGKVYVDSVFDYDFYKRYLMAFEIVYVVARIEELEVIPKDKKLASGDNVTFLALPPYKGPWEYLKKYFKIKRLAKIYSEKCDCGIFRIPGATANILSKEFKRTNKPFAVELVVDPWEYFSKGTIKSIARPFIQIIWTLFVKSMCLKANGVSYVTEFYLQKKYPSKAIINGESKKYFTSHYSSVELEDNHFSVFKKHVKKNRYVISHVANTFTSYGKGHIPLMKALKVVRDRGYDVSIKFIGDGPLRNEFETISKKVGIENHVEFLGKLSNGNEVRKAISETDLFVFPTRAEGLPRVILEAMSEGLPCISSPTSGIPEILENQYLCEYDDYLCFSEKIIELISNNKLIDLASKQNIEMAKKYSNSILNKRRKEFYMKLRDLAKIKIDFK